jgi:selenocysteine-specific elongation factor
MTVDEKDAKNMLMLLVSEGAIIKVKEDLFFGANAITGLKATLVAYLKSNSEINTPQFKDMTGVSRKYTIPLLEYFDTENITIRIGDIRKLRKQD